ncbi:MAG: hypothetical protein PHU23_00080 [Dehalococcoidales bacterium]|nr:hypothetical protein [Dehalococcoidales bacterium]
MIDNNGHLPPEDAIKFKEFHCTGCGRFLALYAIVEGTIVIKCRRCKEENVLDVHVPNITVEQVLTVPGTGANI